jgi:hypothetical protein
MTDQEWDEATSVSSVQIADTIPCPAPTEPQNDRPPGPVCLACGTVHVGQWWFYCCNPAYPEDLE